MKGGWVFKVVMEGHTLAWKNRAALFGVVANREDIIEMQADEFVHVFGPLVRNVNAEFLHHRYGFRAHRSRVRAGAENLISISKFVAKHTLSHLAAS
jgi:hypothetical protein